jgi:hypothetical protein
VTDDTTDDTADGTTDGGPAGLSRRTLIRLLVGVGFGIPLLVEGLTFLGLVGDQLGGRSDETESGTTATGAPSGVGVGDDCLPETDREETLADAAVREADADRWPFSVTVDVTNGGDEPYEFQLLAAHTAAGERIAGRASTGRIAPGETATVTGEWSIPAGAMPVAVDVVALVYGEEIETVERRVELASVPVRGN